MTKYKKIVVHSENRLPKNQVVTEKWPVFSYKFPNFPPEIELSEWQLKIWGATNKEITLNWDEFLSLPITHIQVDMHCVTKWSKLDMKWSGVLVSELLKLAELKPEATHVMQHGYDGYTTNVAIEVLEQAIVAYQENGEALREKHGKPARVIIPSRWAWKGAKWICGFEAMTQDKKGYWEVAGNYHNNGDPWGKDEERKSG